MSLTEWMVWFIATAGVTLGLLVAFALVGASGILEDRKPVRDSTSRELNEPQ